MKPKPMTSTERCLVYASSVERYIPTDGYAMPTQRLVEQGLLERHLAGGYTLSASGHRELARLRARRAAK